MPWREERCCAWLSRCLAQSLQRRRPDDVASPSVFSLGLFGLRAAPSSWAVPSFPLSHETDQRHTVHIINKVRLEQYYSAAVAVGASATASSVLKGCCCCSLSPPARHHAHPARPASPPIHPDPAPSATPAASHLHDNSSRSPNHNHSPHNP